MKLSDKISWIGGNLGLFTGKTLDYITAGTKNYGDILPWTMVKPQTIFRAVDMKIGGKLNTLSPFSLSLSLSIYLSLIIFLCGWSTSIFMAYLKL